MSNMSDQTTKPSKKTRLIVDEIGIDTETGIVGRGHSYDNGKTFVVDGTIYGRVYHADDHGKIWQGIQDKVAKVVAPAKSAADSAVSAADAAVASAQVTSAAVSAVASATVEAKQGANDAMSRAKSAWDVATGAKEAVTDFDPLLKRAQSDAGKALSQIADTASALSDAKTAFDSDVAAAKELASTAQTTADSAVKSASSVADDLAAVANQAKANANGITKVTSDVGLLQTTVANNSGNISTIQETAKQIQQAVSDNAGNITVAKQTADSAVTVASDARSSATVAIQTASQASVTAQNASGQAASAVITANGAMTTASNAKSDATVAVQTASGASLTATNANNDATVAKQTASEAKVQASNAESDFAQLSIRAGKIEASVANNSGAIASVQQTANGLTTTVADIKANGGGVNLASGTRSEDQSAGDASQTTGWNIPTIATFDNPQAGQQYTISVNTRNNGGSWRIQIWDGTSPTQRAKWITSGNNFTSTQEQKNTFTFTWPSGSNKYLIVQLGNGNNGGQIFWNSAMLEEGTVAHTWSPAHEDLQNQFTQIKQSIDGVTTIINDPKTGLNATYQTAAGNVTTISNVKSDVYQLETTATGLTSRVGNLESKTNTQETAIEQNKNAVTLKADQTDVDTLKGTVASNSAAISVQADEIKQKVTSSDVQGLLNNGGYATQTWTSSQIDQTSHNFSLTLTALQTQVDNSAVGTNLLMGTSSSEQSYTGDFSTVPGFGWGNTSVQVAVNAGSTYTYSINLTKLTSSFVLGYWGYDSNKNYTTWIHSDAYSSTGESSWTFTVPSGISYIVPHVVHASDGFTCTAKEEKLERGSHATDWSPAPSDMATVTSVTNLSATVDGIQAQVYNSDGSSKITQLSNLIATKVSSDDFNSLSQSVNLQTLDSADINNMKTNGHYFVHNLANNPIGGWVYVDVTGNGNDRIRQDVYQDSGAGHKYRRLFYDSWTGWEEGATESEITQLSDDINLRVKSADLISQINLQAGTTLIQSNKLVLDAKTTVFTGDAFIPDAYISTVNADKLMFYGSDGTSATMGASVAQYDDDKTKSTINLQYSGGIEIHSSDQQGSILTMHDNTIRLASKSWGDNPNAYQYSGFYAAPNYSLMNTYHRDGTTSGVAIDDNQIHIYGSSKDQQLGALKADVGWYSINGKTGSLTGDQISLKAGNTQAVLTDNNININNASDTNDKNYDVAIHVKGWAEMTGWFTCMGITQTSLLSTKTRIEPLDTKVALDKIVSANVNTYQFKTDVAKGKTKRHASVIIDDVHDVAEYYTPEEFISENRMGRDDGDIIGYLMGAVQELKKQLDELKEKI